MSTTNDARSAPVLPVALSSKGASTVRVLLAALVTGGVGAAVGLQFGRRVLTAERTFSLHPLDALGLLSLMVLVIAVHELGHVAAGLLGRMRFLMLTAGPVSVTRSNHRLRVRLNTSVNLWGGLAVMLPTSMSRFRERFAMMVAGGPAASLLLACVGALIAFGTDGRANFYGMALGLLSGGICFVTSMPMTFGGFTSDGGQLLALRRADAGAELRAMLTTLASASLTGTRPRDADAALVQQALTTDGPAPMRLRLQLFAALRALDSGADAAPHFEALLPLFPELPAGQRQGVALWIAWYYSAMRHDVATAVAWEASAVGGFVEPVQRDLTTAAIARARGDDAGARAAAARGLAREVGIDAGGVQLTRDLLRQAAMPSSAPGTA